MKKYIKENLSMLNTLWVIAIIVSIVVGYRVRTSMGILNLMTAIVMPFVLITLLFLERYENKENKETVKEDNITK